MADKKTGYYIGGAVILALAVLASLSLIPVKNAWHLDANRTIIAKVTAQVIALDDSWAGIPDKDYLRIQFTRKLSPANDILIYAQGNGSIEVYKKGAKTKIAEFQNISQPAFYRIYLNYMTGTADAFDLKSIGDISYDYIVDPTLPVVNSNIYEDVVPEVNFTHLNISTAAPYNKLVAYYPFDDNVSSTTAYDYSNNSNDGTLSVSPINTEGLYGNAYKFNGINQGINLTASNKFISANDQAVTMMAWIYPFTILASTIGNKVFSIQATGSALSMSLAVGNNKPIFLFNSATNYYFTNAIAVNTWTHLAIVYNGSCMTAYINGTLDTACTAGTLSVGGVQLATIGNNGQNGRFFNGTIDEVMFFNINLSATDISNIYNNQSARFKTSGNATYNTTTLGGYNRVNITSLLQNNMLTNISLRIYENASNAWTDYQNITNAGDYQFTINSTATIINFSYKFVPDSYAFYSPIQLYNISINYWNAPSTKYYYPNSANSNAWKGQDVRTATNNVSKITTAYSTQQLLNVSLDNNNYVDSVGQGGDDCSALTELANCNQNTSDCVNFYQEVTYCTTTGDTCGTGSPCQAYGTHKYLLKINEPIASINNISLLLKVNSTSGAGSNNITLFAWNYTGLAYNLLNATNTSFISKMNMTYLLISPITDYVNSSGNLYLLTQQNNSAFGDRVYYVQAIVDNITAALPSDTEYPLFYNYTDNNASLINTGTATFSANINSTNGTAGIQFNYTNYTAFNSTDNFFNTTVTIANSGLYNYFWWAYGNGTSTNFNKSATRSYTVNSSCTWASGIWRMPCGCNVTDADVNLLGNQWIINGTGLSNITRRVYNYSRLWIYGTGGTCGVYFHGG
jgi:hypothetical protein